MHNTEKKIQVVCTIQKNTKKNLGCMHNTEKIQYCCISTPSQVFDILTQYIRNTAHFKIFHMNTIFCANAPFQRYNGFQFRLCSIRICQCSAFEVHAPRPHVFEVQGQRDIILTQGCLGERSPPPLHMGRAGYVSGYSV